MVPRKHGADLPVLTSGDISRATGIGVVRLHRWVQQGWLKPRNAHRGRGRHCLYSIADLAAINAGLWFYEQGYGASYSGHVCQLLAEKGSELQAELMAGRDWLSPGRSVRGEHTAGEMVAPPSKEVRLHAVAEGIVPFPGYELWTRLLTKIVESLRAAFDRGDRGVKEHVLVGLATMLSDADKVATKVEKHRAKSSRRAAKKTVKK